MSASKLSVPRRWADEDWPARSVPAAIAWAVAEFGPEHRIFRFSADGVEWSLAELQEDVQRFGRALLANGVGPGDVVSVWAPGRPLWPLVALGAPSVSATVCGLNTRYREDELRHVLGMVAPRLIFVATEFLDDTAIDLLRGVIEGLRASGELAPDRCEIIAAPPDGGDAKGHGVRSLSEFLGDADAVSEQDFRARAAAATPQDTAIIQFTSGSTGRAKGVVISHDAALRTAFHLTKAEGLGREDTMFSPMPFYHIGGTLCTGLAALVSGTRMIIPERFDAAETVDTIERQSCTAFQGHAAMYTMMIGELRSRPRDLSALRKGWAVAPSALMRTIHDELGMVDVIGTYGLSEGGFVCGGIPADPLEKRLHTIGLPVPGMRLELRDADTGGAVGPDGVGQIWVAGPVLMSGYLHDPVATDEALHDGWLATGDLGTYDEDGYLLFAGRLKDMIKPGGENVSIAEVERFLLEDPRLNQVAVVGIPDERLGEVPAAMIEPAAGATVSPEEIIARCRSAIANFKVPRRVLVVEELPLLDVGKVDRVTVRAAIMGSAEIEA